MEIECWYAEIESQLIPQLYICFGFYTGLAERWCPLSY